MASEGPNNPGTFSSDSSFGDDAWSDTGNTAASDNSYATAALSMGFTSEYLNVTNFSFSIPAGATIDGITVNVERNGTQADTGIVDTRVRIIKGGTVGSEDKSSMDTWPTGDGTQTYGSTSDLWSETWTNTDINASNFGMVIACSPDGMDETASVDHITITVEYTLSVGGGSVFVSDSLVNIT